MFGRMYRERPAKIGWLVFFIGFNTLYLSMFILGYNGMPRRYFDYPPQYFTGQLVATIGSWILAAGLIIIFRNLIVAFYRGPKAPDNPWGGSTLEWQVPSPPPHENFEKIPVITRGPYSFE